MSYQVVIYCPDKHVLFDANMPDKQGECRPALSLEVVNLLIQQSARTPRGDDDDNGDASLRSA